MRALAIGYHDVADPDERAATGLQGPGADRYKVARAAFARQLDLLAGAGFRPELDGPQSLTFDDGGRSALHAAAPALEKHGWHGWFFLTTSLVGTPGFLTPEEARELAAAGHGIGSHAHTHRPLDRLPDGELREEWSRSRAALEDMLGTEVVTASVPTGAFEQRVAEAAAAAGLRVLFTSEPTTRVREVDGVTVLGRFAVHAATSDARVAALGRGARGALAAEAAGWRLRRGARRALGPVYGRLRESVLSRRA